MQNLGPKLGRSARSVLHSKKKEDSKKGERNAKDSQLEMFESATDLLTELPT